MCPLKCRNDLSSNNVRVKPFSANLNYAGFFVMSRSENCGEVQVVRQDDVISTVGKADATDSEIMAFAAANARGREPSAARDSCPLKASCARESNFALFGKPRGIAQRLENVFTLQIRIVRQQLLDGMASTDLSHDHPDRDTHAADARFSTHHGGIPSDAIQLRHRRLPSKCCLFLLG